MEKFKPKSQRELSNQEIEIALYQYSTSKDTLSEYGESHIEWLHERLTRLDEEEMAILKGRYWEAKSYGIIANEMGHPLDHKWALRKLDVILEKLRAKD